MANTITITGNLVKEPKFQMTSNNKPMVMFTLAENTFHNGKEDVLYWDCFNIGEQAEKFSKDFVKGREYTIYGKAVPNNYEKDGVKQAPHSCIELTGSDLVGLDLPVQVVANKVYGLEG